MSGRGQLVRPRQELRVSGHEAEQNGCSRLPVQMMLTFCYVLIANTHETMGALFGIQRHGDDLVGLLLKEVKKRPES